MADDYNAHHNANDDHNQRRTFLFNQQNTEQSRENSDSEPEASDREESTGGAPSDRPNHHDPLSGTNPDSTGERSQRLRSKRKRHKSGQPAQCAISQSSIEMSRNQETNQQIVSFLANNHLPDLICETFIELLFISVFLAVSWIFVMIIQLHCHQLQQPAKFFYCNTKFLASLMYCNSKSHYAYI